MSQYKHKIAGLVLACCVVPSTVQADSATRVIDYTSENCTFIQQLSPYQRDVARKAFLHGDIHDLGYTMVALSWRESHLGINKVRLQDGKYGSYGVTHIFLDYHTKGWDNWSRNKYAEELVTNDDFAIQEGLDRLLYWKEHAPFWRKMLAMYNSGWNGGEGYAAGVAKTVREIKTCDFI